MRDRTLAVRYARALYAALPGPDAAERAGEFLSALAAATVDSAELRDVLLNPAVSRSDRKALLRSLADSRGADREVRNFLSVLVDHGRAGALPAIAEAFRALKDEESGVVSATLTTAFALPASIEERARLALERISGKKVRLTCVVDPEVLGGASARIGSTVWDGSLRSQLAAVRRRMAEE